MHPNDKHKPEKIGDDEPLTEGNVVIQWAEHHVIAVTNPHALENKKDNAEADMYPVFWTLSFELNN